MSKSLVIRCHRTPRSQSRQRKPTTLRKNSALLVETKLPPLREHERICTPHQSQSSSFPHRLLPDVPAPLSLMLSKAEIKVSQFRL
jgi:hypothetical protein